MVEPLPGEIDDLLQRMLQRGAVAIVERVRQERERIAARMAHEGTLRSGAFVTAVAKAYGDAFQDYARTAMADGLKLVLHSTVTDSPQVPPGVRQKLETNFESAAASLRGEAGAAGPMKNEIPVAVNAVLHKKLYEAKRDLAIEFDLATLPFPQGSVADPASIDSLVGLQNRKGFETEFGNRTRDPNERLSLVMFDIDHFKDVNDKNGGHLVGDEALKSVAAIATRCVKGKGIAFRWAGDEFVMLLPNHTVNEALSVAERFRHEVSAVPHTSKHLTLSVSVGVAEWPAHGADLEALQGAADKAMYDAKNRGRNLVRYFGEPEPELVAPTTSREPSRKQPEPGSLTNEEAESIRKQYFTRRMAKCPRDEAILEVEDTTSLGQARNSLYISCPMCGLSAEIE